MKSRRDVILMVGLLTAGLAAVGPGCIVLEQPTNPGSVLATPALDQGPVDIVADPVTGHTFVLTMPPGPSGAYGLGIPSSGGEVWMLDSATGTVLKRRPVAVFDDRLHASVAPGQHRLFVATGSNEVAMLDTCTGALLALIPLEGVAESVAVDDRGARVFVRDDAGRLSVLDARSGRLLRTLAGGTPTLTVFRRSVLHAAFIRVTRYPDAARQVGNTVIALDTAFHGAVLHSGRAAAGSAAGQGTITVIDAWDESTLGVLHEPNAPDDVAGEARTGRLFVADPTAGRVGILDARNGRPLRTTTVAGSPREVVVDERAGHVFVYNDADDMVSMLDARSGTLLRTIPLSGDAAALAVDERHGLLFVVTQDLGNAAPEVLQVVDTRRGVPLRPLDLPADGYPVGLAVDGREGRVLLASTGGSMPPRDSWDRPWLQDLRQVFPALPWHPSPPWSIAGSVRVLGTIGLR